MIITCPNCSATYDIEDARFLPSGRSVRCSDCTVSWFVPAPQPIEALLPSSRINPQNNNQDQHVQREQNQYNAPNSNTVASTAKPSLFRQNNPSPLGTRPNTNHSVGQDNGRQSAHPPHTEQQATRPRPKWGPMAERRMAPEQDLWRKPHEPMRRQSDQILDTDWEDIDHHHSHRDKASAPPQQDASEFRKTRNDNAHAVPLSPIENNEADRDWSNQKNEPETRHPNRDNNSRIKIGTPLNPNQTDAPGEFFAAVNVQPRELERALKRVRRKAEARDKNRLTPMRIAGWASLLMVIITTFYAGYHYRHDVVRIWPSSSKVYAVVGINAKPYGLSLENINHRVALSTTGLIVEISGELHNQGEKPIAPPLLQAEALDIHGKLLSSWTFNPDQPLVEGAGFVSFKTRSPAPEGIVEVVLSFAPEKSKTNKK